MYTLMHTTPVQRKNLHMHGAQNTCLNAYHIPRKKCACTRACAPMQRCKKFFAMKATANFSWVLHEHHAGCRLPPAQPPAQLLSRPNPSPDAVCSTNPSKSTLAHEVVTTTVSHKHHLIIRVVAGLIQFVYGSHSRLAADLITQFYFRHGFRELFLSRGKFLVPSAWGKARDPSKISRNSLRSHRIDSKCRQKILESYIKNMHRAFAWNVYFPSKFCFIKCHPMGPAPSGSHFCSWLGTFLGRSQ